MHVVEAIKHKQTPLEVLKQMQVMRGKPVDFDIGQEIDRMDMVVRNHGYNVRKTGFGTGEVYTSSYVPSKSSTLIGPPRSAGDSTIAGPVILSSAANSTRMSARLSAAAASAATSVQPAAVARHNVPSSFAATSSTSATQIAPSSVISRSYGFSEQQSGLMLGVPSKHQPFITLCTAVCNAKLVKVKAEMFNIMYMFPEKILRFPDSNEEDIAEIEAAGKAAAQSVFAGAAKLKESGATSGTLAAIGGGDASDHEDGGKPAAAVAAPSINGVAIDLSDENVARLAEKATKKAKRRLRRKLAFNRFVKSVESATTAEELMQCVKLLENAISPVLMFAHNRECLPARGTTVAAVAIRVFTLDRAICYDELKGAELAAANCDVRLRTQFTPKCMQSVNCTRALCHAGKCTSMPEQPSRMPELIDRPLIPGVAGGSMNALANYQARMAMHRGNNAMGYYGIGGGYNNPYRNTAGFRSEDEPLAEFLKRMKLEKREIDIELVQPYVPPLAEVSDIQFV